MGTDRELELDDAIHKQVTEYCDLGNQLADQDKHEEAVVQFNKAWKLIPEPKNDWEASTWILGAIADSCFFLGKRTSAKQALEYAMTCPGGLGNPFLHLRLGQVLLDSGELDAAAEELIRAYMGAGTDIFQAEDPKYLDFLKTRAKL
jgi:tetratricopeptide (TPR) repeat protein